MLLMVGISNIGECEHLVKDQRNYILTAPFTMRGATPRSGSSQRIHSDQLLPNAASHLRRLKPGSQGNIQDVAPNRYEKIYALVGLRGCCGVMRINILLSVFL